MPSRPRSEGLRRRIVWRGLPRGMNVNSLSGADRQAPRPTDRTRWLERGVENLPHHAGDEVAHAGHAVAEGEQVVARQPAVRRPVGEDWVTRGAGQQGARFDRTMRLHHQSACALPARNRGLGHQHLPREEAASWGFRGVPQLRRSSKRPRPSSLTAPLATSINSTRERVIRGRTSNATRPLATSMSVTESCSPRSGPEGGRPGGCEVVALDPVARRTVAHVHEAAAVHLAAERVAGSKAVGSAAGPTGMAAAATSAGSRMRSGYPPQAAAL